VDRAPRPFVRLSGPMAAQELDLQMVERIEVREAIANAAREGWIVVQ
jgi:hypothetical protein